MRSVPGDLLGPLHGAPELLSQAAAVLLREAARLPAPLAGGLPAISSFDPSLPEPGAGSLELPIHLSGAAPAGNQHEQRLKQPFRQAVPAAPVAGFDKDRWRQQAHELIESLLITFKDATGDQGSPSEDQVPLIHCVAPVQPGGTGRASLSIVNEEGAPAHVTLYCSNFIADSGYDIPSLRVGFAPRVAEVAAHARADFEITIAIGPQVPPGLYSGLVQALGSKYVKAVLSVEVL